VASVESRNLDQPDESRTPDKTEVNVVSVGGNEVGRFTFQPGWRWSECVKPVAGTDSCEMTHLGYVVSGQLHVAHDDGTAVDVGPGDAYVIEPGHDAWVVGNETFVGYEFEPRAAEEYAKSN
jgi:mannose-6-phosphate isomerase-like protein (cupin superfamily)